MRGLKRMKWIGVTEFYDQSICALRSLIHEKPMCTCAAATMAKVVHQTGIHITHGTNPHDVVLTGGQLKRFKALRTWRVQSLAYAYGLTHLNVTLAKFDLTCLLGQPR